MSDKLIKNENSGSQAGMVKPLVEYREPDYPAEAKACKRGKGSAFSPLNTLKNGIAAAGLFTALFLGSDMLSVKKEAAAWDFSTNNPGKVVSVNTNTEKQMRLAPGRLIAMESAKTGAKTAPLFEYGSGYASTGGVAYVPPAFTSEADARKIIEGEFKKAGINFETHDKVITDLKIRQKQAGMEPQGKSVFSDKPGNAYYTVTLDGYNKERNLGYIYVSEEDYKKLVPESYCGTLSIWAIKDSASVIRTEMEKYGKINMIVFYDPVTRPTRGIPDNPGKNKQQLQDYLKKQVSESIKWIKANKI